MCTHNHNPTHTRTHTLPYFYSICPHLWHHLTFAEDTFGLRIRARLRIWTFLVLVSVLRLDVPAVFTLAVLLLLELANQRPPWRATLHTLRNPLCSPRADLYARYTSIFFLF